MTASEFAFLALGLMLGVASGAALMEVLRSRPPAPREVRVTVERDSVPIRRSTLAADPFAGGLAGPAPYGPGDRRAVDRPPVSLSPIAPSASGRTTVPSRGRAALALPLGGGYRAASPAGNGNGRHFVAIAVRPEIDGLYEALVAAEARAAVVLGGADARPDAARSDGEDGRAAALVGVGVATMTAVADPADRPHAAAGRKSASGARTGDAPVRATDPTAVSRTGPCGDLRATAEDRCAVAARAREGATAARESLRDAQRAYDDHLTRAYEAEAIADPRAMRTAKEVAQQTFRAARDGAKDRRALEAAASAWLEEVNRINATARAAAARAAREHARATALIAVIERLTVEADAARISAESAEEACLQARQAVADCEEQTASPPAPPAAPPVRDDRYPEEAPELERGELAEAPSDRQARILRLLRGDNDALRRTVAELAGDDPEARRRWQLLLTGFVDAVTAQAIDASAIDVAPANPFWKGFDRAQWRDIIGALAALGYRYDGLGGFADGRVPSQRDLSLAVGYAGLDPMRIRHWPTDAEMGSLFTGATVTADEYLAEAAGGLTLGELVALLGPRADALTDLWNDWGTVRPRLLATD